MKVLLIGAGGFVGRAFTTRLLRDPWGVEHLTLVDQTALQKSESPIPLSVHQGDFANADFCRSVIGDSDVVVVLAAVLGGMAEANYDLARRVNIDATLSLFQMLRNIDRPTRVIFASTIGVFGHPLHDPVDDYTVARPDMIYGVQKLMMETALSHFSRRGWLDGLSLRLPGIMARPGAHHRLKSAFLNNLFYAVRDGRNIELPVPPDGTTWLMSVGQMADNLIHSLRVAIAGSGPDRALNMPCLCPSIAELVAALFERYPDSLAKVTYAPDLLVTAQFARYPSLSAAAAERLGFTADANLAALIRDAIQEGDGL